MSTLINNRNTFAATVFTVLLGIALLGHTTAVAQQIPVEPPQAHDSQSGPPGDPIRQLNLSAEQAAKIRAIREQAKDERVALNQRLRQKQLALDEAIESENVSETVVEQRSGELAEAQAAVTRLRALTELRIRRVMTPEQLNKLRALKQQALQFRQQRQNQSEEPMRPRDRQRRPDALQRDGNPRPDFPSPHPPGSLPLKPRP